MEMSFCYTCRPPPPSLNWSMNMRLRLRLRLRLRNNNNNTSSTSSIVIFPLPLPLPAVVSQSPPIYSTATATATKVPFNQKHLRPLLTLPAASTTDPAPALALEEEEDVEKRKQCLLRAVQDTERGLVATPHQRSSIEEALVSVEKYDAGLPIELGKLNGTWRLQYTSASDVLILLQSSSTFPFFQVGPIYQTFKCQNQSDGGIVQNIVRWSIPNLLEEQEGATLVVSAMFSIVSMRNIYLQFDEIAIQNINISEQLQALLTPALLPRSFFSLQILQFIRSFRAQIPVRNSGWRRSIGGLYYLSYLDGNMLLGRADGGGVFMFTKSQPVLYV